MDHIYFQDIEWLRSSGDALVHVWRDTSMYRRISLSHSDGTIYEVVNQINPLLSSQLAAISAISLPQLGGYISLYRLAVRYYDDPPLNSALAMLDGESYHRIRWRLLIIAMDGVLNSTGLSAAQLDLVEDLSMRRVALVVNPIAPRIVPFYSLPIPPPGPTDIPFLTETFRRSGEEFDDFSQVGQFAGEMVRAVGHPRRFQ